MKIDVQICRYEDMQIKIDGRGKLMCKYADVQMRNYFLTLLINCRKISFICISSYLHIRTSKNLLHFFIFNPEFNNRHFTTSILQGKGYPVQSGFGS